MAILRRLRSPVRVYYCDHYEVPLPPEHRFPMSKYARLRRALVEQGVLRPEELFASFPAPLPEIARVHAASYVSGVLSGTLEEKLQRRIGLPWSPALVQRSLASVQGTLSAARDALREGIAGNLAGGTHHAFSEEGSGYCVFNDHAVTLASLLEAGRVRRALIVDVDVHQGDGTAALFAHDPRVFTLSLHGEKNFPFRKQASSLDVGLPDQAGDEVYLEALSTALGVAFARADPEIVLVQGGVDVLREDRLGRLSLSQSGVMARDRLILSRTHQDSIPVVLTLGGGYAEPIEATIEAHVNTYRVARALYG
jgi:acetoin utilization deacetylase AcuC-like enzyme